MSPAEGFFRTYAPEVGAYPTLRLDRIGLSPAATGQPTPALPRTRAIWFEVITNANTRTTTSTPNLTGPALLRRITARVNAGNDPPNTFLEVGVMPAQFVETNVVLGTPKPWRPLIDSMNPRSGNIAAGLEGFLQATSLSTGDHAQFDLDVIIPDPTFVLTFSNENASGVVTRWVGYFTIVEALSPAVLGNFL